MSTKSVQNAHISAQLRDLHDSLVEIVGVMNRPQRDEAMVREAGISLDRALFPLLVLVERLGHTFAMELSASLTRPLTDQEFAAIGSVEPWGVLSTRPLGTCP